MAGEPGFEPGLTESESVGLPLTYSPIGNAEAFGGSCFVGWLARKQCDPCRQCAALRRWKGVYIQVGSGCNRGGDIFSPVFHSLFENAAKSLRNRRFFRSSYIWQKAGACCVQVQRRMQNMPECFRNAPHAASEILRFWRRGPQPRPRFKPDAYEGCSFSRVAR